MRRTALLVAAIVASARTAAAQSPVDSAGRVTFRVLPETVTVGQPFMVSLRAVPAPGRVAVAPPVPDTGGIVEPLDPAAVTRRGDTLLVRYRLIAWQPGVLTIPLAPVQMKRGASEMPVPVDMRVVVASVLPGDSASRVPKPPRDPFPVAARWWENWWKWLLGIVLTLAAIYLWFRWRSRTQVVHPDANTPIAKAEAAFARLDARQLPASGEGGRHVTLATEIVRQYLADIEPTLGLSLTKAELVAAAAPIAGIPGLRLTQLLEQTDGVRFSGKGVELDAVRRVSGLARELVREIDRVRTSHAAQAA